MRLFWTTLPLMLLASTLHAEAPLASPVPTANPPTACEKIRCLAYRAGCEQGDAHKDATNTTCLTYHLGVVKSQCGDSQPTRLDCLYMGPDMPKDDS
jgi:hypothetical protein